MYEADQVLTYRSTSQHTVQNQLNKFLRDYQKERHEGSEITIETIESISSDEKEAWRTIRKDLQDIGLTVGAFEANKEFILKWFQEGFNSGAFESDVSTEISHESTVKTETSNEKPKVSPKVSSSSSFATGALKESTVRRTPRSGLRLVALIRNLFRSGIELEISEPYDFRHVTHCSIDPSTGAYTVTDTESSFVKNLRADLDREH